MFTRPRHPLLTGLPAGGGALSTGWYAALAAEPTATYRTGDTGADLRRSDTDAGDRAGRDLDAARHHTDTDDPAGGFTSRTAARLAEVAGLAGSRDRLMGRLVRLLIDIKGADDLAQVTGGMSLHVWLQHQGRATHAEARDLLGAADVLVHMPATVAGLCDRWLSWPQTIAIAKAARKVPVRLRSELDALVADAMTAHRRLGTRRAGC
jgi:hypothetical protein